jgi:dienelactone hydrolase
VDTLEDQAVHVLTSDAELEGDLVVPENAAGVVLFSHGSGSSRKSPRNRRVAAELQKRGFATLLLDLLTAEEERIDRDTGHLRFDIGLLARRLAGATDWLKGHPSTRELRIGYFGASTGAAAALVAASWRPVDIGAVVSRGGRPDLAGRALSRVESPTLLIVGGNDVQVIALNREAFARLSCEKSLQIVPGATHLFEETGAIEAVSRLAGDWFRAHLPQAES